MRLRIEEIGELLDPLVLRDRSLRRSRVQEVEEQITKSLAKGLSFDLAHIENYNPTRPQTAHVPYLHAEDGSGVLPYPVEHWEELGKLPQFYQTTKLFYQKLGTDWTEKERPLRVAQYAALEAEERLTASLTGVSDLFKSFREDVHDGIVKADQKAQGTSAGVAVGSVHQYKDGNWYRKVAPGEWKLVKQGTGSTGKADATKRGHVDIEASHREKTILAALDRRLKHKAELNEHGDQLRAEFDEKLKQVQAQHAPKAGAGEEEPKGKPKVPAEASGKKQGGEQDQPKEGPPESPAEKPKVKTETTPEEQQSDGKSAPTATPAPGDDGRPKQFETDEGDMTYYLSGKDLDTPVVQQFISEFERDLVEMEELRDTMTQLGAKGYCSRLKGTTSLLEKMKRGKFANRSLNTVTDVVGSRAVVGDANEQKRIVNFLRSKFKVVEVDDFAEKGRSDSGYRAVHLLLRTSSNKIVEFQVKTLNQQLFSSYMHNAVYKGEEKIKKDPEVLKFALALSNYLARADRGEGVTEKELGPRPKEPKALQGIAPPFPWHVVESQQLTDLKKAREAEAPGGGQPGEKSPGSAQRVFIVAREKNETIDVQEYVSLERAKSARQRFERTHPERDYPMVTAPDQQTLFAVFPEYRPPKEAAPSEKAEVKKSFERYVPRFRQTA